MFLIMNVPYNDLCNKNWEDLYIMLTGQEEEIIIGGIIFIILFFVILISIGCKIASSGNQFRDNSQKIKEGMSK